MTTPEEPNDQAKNQQRESSKDLPQVPASAPDDEERKYWHWLNEEYSGKLIRIHHAATKLIRDCESAYPQLAHYTPHGEAHMQAVENILHRLIPGEAVEELRMRERFYLLASAWVHDVGMLRGLNGDDERDLIRFPDDLIRREHHKRAERFIVNQFSRLDVENEDAHALGLLSLYHRRSADLGKCPKSFPVKNESVRLRLLAAYLRFADSLDTDQSRSPASDYAICIAYNIPVNSKLHWIKSRLVSGITVEPKKHRIVVHFKEPHAFSLLQELKKLKFSEKDIPLLRQNLASLRKMVVQDLREELNSVKNTLIRGGVTYFLDVEERCTQLAIDDQVFPELLHLANNFDLISHPSATRLMYMVLGTVERILRRYDFSDKDQKERPGRQADAAGKTDQNSDCREENTAGKAESLHCDQKHRPIRKHLQEFLADLECQVLESRRCHLGLSKLVKQLKDLTLKSSIDEIRRKVEAEKDTIDQERRNIRRMASGYFYSHLRETGRPAPQDDSNSREGESTASSGGDGSLRGITEKAVREFLMEQLRAIEQKAENRKYRDEESEAGNERQKLCVNILVYGYSELVIKALCGFRDVVVRLLLQVINDPDTPRISIHKLPIERMASEVFRIFVCEGQPKTITAPNDALAYHDGSRYAIALARLGFTDVIVLPDLVVGNLLYRSRCGQLAPVHMVMLGANGLEFAREESPGVSHGTSDIQGEADTTEIFRHSSGHMAIAALTDFFNTKSTVWGTKLVLVLGTSKCDFVVRAKMSQKHHYMGCCEGEKEEKDGYRFRRLLKGENVRNQAFLVRDPDVRKELYESQVHLYNPREDAVPLSMVDDVILDFGFFTNVREDSNPLRRELEKRTVTRQGS